MSAAVRPPEDGAPSLGAVVAQRPKGSSAARRARDIGASGDADVIRA